MTLWVTLPCGDVAQDVRTEFIDVAVERSGILAMLDQVEEAAARLHDLCRQIVHVEIALVADDDARRGVIQHEALRHVVQRGVEPVLFRFQPLLRFPILPGHLPDDQEQDEGDHQRGQTAAAIRNRVCARQSASAAETVVVATTTIGKWLNSAAEPSRS